MSGRKSSEVAAILRQGEQVRRMTDRVYSNDIKNDYDGIINAKNYAEELAEKINKDQAQITDSAKELFGETAANYADEMKSLQKLARDKAGEFSGVSSDANRSMGDLGNLDKSLYEADREAETIRQAISGKEWYCDEEYKRAGELVKKYKELRDQRISVSQSISAVHATASAKLNELREYEARFEQVKKQIAEMNANAQKQKSGEMRAKLLEAISGIAEEDARKFLPEEYASICKEAEGAKTFNDERLINEFPAIFGKIASFQMKLTESVARWQREKDDAESRMKKARELTDLELIGPIDYYNDGEDGKKMPLFDYLRQFASENLKANYDASMSKANKMMAAEDFTGVAAEADNIADQLRQARDKALKLQEDMLKKTELAGAIQDVMYDMKYDITMEVIDGNPANGYRLTCSIEGSDEKIEFDKIDTDDNGGYVVEINHSESTTGTCKSTWQDIVNRMRNAGIPITDVKKNGATILKEESIKQTINQKQRMRGNS